MRLKITQSYASNTYIDLIGDYWFKYVTKVNKPIKEPGIFFTYGKHKN